MNIKQTIITATVALTMVAMIAPMAANAMTAAQMQAEIATLQAQLNALNSTTTTTTSGSMPAACVGVTFTRNLRVGMSGQDVKCLQAILNLSASTQVSLTGAGSPGMESMYFGPKTLHAVMIWQAAAGFTPASQIGPLSRAKLNAWLAGTSSTTTTTTTTTYPAGCTSASGYSTTTGQPCSAGAVVQGTGPISVMLSNDSPATGGSIVGGQATADLAHFTFTGNGTVTSVTLQRSGISDQNTLTNVYLFDGNTRITDGYSFNINGQLVMNGLSIAVAGSHEISVRADVLSTAANTASSIAVSLVGYTANGTSSTVNVNGGLMMVVVGNLATAYLGSNTVYNSNTVTTVNAGTSGYTFWSAPLQVNVRSVWLKMADFKIVGSAPSDALSNMRMFIDGVDTGKLATVMAINGSNYAVLDLTSAPVSLATGSHTIDFRADIQKGTNRTVQISVQQASDFTITDPQLGVNIALLGPSGAAFSTNTGANVSIATGSATVVVDPTFNAQTNVSGGSANAVIGRFIVHPYGEDVKVTSLVVTPTLSALASTTYTSGITSAVTGSYSTTVTSTTGFVAGNVVSIAGGVAGVGTITSITSGTVMVINVTSAVTTPAGAITVVDKGLNNVTIYFNGSQVGSQQNTAASGNAMTFQLGSQMIAPAGQDSTLEVRSDLQGSTNVAYGAGTIVVTLPTGSSNAQGQSSQNTVNVPTAAVATNGLSMQTGLLAVSKNSAYLNQNIAPNMTGVRIGSYVIQNQSTSESIRLTSYSIITGTGTSLTNTSGTIGGNTGSPTISNFSALRTSDTTGSGATPIQFSGTGSGNTSTDVFSVNTTLAPGASMVLDVFANTSTATSGGITTTLNVSSIGVVDNIATTSGAKSGQILTLGTGTIANPPTLVVSSTTPSQYIATGGGATNASQATFNFVSTSGSSTITELQFTVSGADASPSNTVTNVCVDATHCASPVSGTADLTGLNLLVPNGGGGLTQTVQLSYSSVGTSGLTQPTNTVVSLAYAKYSTGGATKTIGTSALCTTVLGGACSDTLASAVAANTLTLVGSRPAVVVANGGNTGMILNTSTKVGQVTISADAKGAIKLEQLNFGLGFSGFTGGTPTSISSAFLALGGQTTAIPGVTCTAVGITNIVCGNHSANGVAYTYANDFIIAAGQSQQFDLYMTTPDEANTGTNKAQVSTSLVNGTSTSAAAGTTSAFLWDDTATNGGTNSTGLTGTLIYGFPTNAYSVSQ